MYCVFFFSKMIMPRTLMTTTSVGLLFGFHFLNPNLCQLFDALPSATFFSFHWITTILVCYGGCSLLFGIHFLNPNLCRLFDAWPSATFFSFHWITTILVCYVCYRFNYTITPSCIRVVIFIIILSKVDMTFG